MTLGSGKGHGGCYPAEVRKEEKINTFCQNELVKGLASVGFLCSIYLEVLLWNLVAQLCLLVAIG